MRQKVNYGSKNLQINELLTWQSLERVFKLKRRHLQLAIYCILPPPLLHTMWTVDTVGKHEKVDILRENQMPSSNLALLYFSSRQLFSKHMKTWIRVHFVNFMISQFFLAKSLLWKSAFVHGVVHFKGFSKDGRMHNASKVQVWVDDTCRNFMHVHGPWRSLEGELGSSFSFVSSSPGATISYWFQGLSNNRF